MPSVNIPINHQASWVNGETDPNFTTSPSRLCIYPAEWGTPYVYPIGTPNPFAEGNMPTSKSNPKKDWYNDKVPKVLNLMPTKKQSGLIGLEIEVEGKNLFTSPFSFWSCHQDGSLRAVGDHLPQEYVLKKPLGVEEVEKALNYLDRKLKEAGSEIQLSNRTSVHVHVNCQKLTFRQVYTYILLYMIFEEVLIDWAGPERAGNLFCLRAKDSEYYIQMLESVLKTGKFAAWKEDLRYSACNVASMIKFGSLEFRALKGTVDMKMIMTWVEMLVHLLEESKTYDNPIEIEEKFTRIGPLPFFQQTFKSRKDLRELLENSSYGISGKLWDGLRMMRDVAHKCEWEKPEKKEEPHEENWGTSPINRFKRGSVVQHSYWGVKAVRSYYNSSSMTSHYTDKNLNEPHDIRPDQPISPQTTLYYFEADSGHWVGLDIRPGGPEDATPGDGIILLEGN